jgi:hypothetical protein
MEFNDRRVSRTAAPAGPQEMTCDYCAKPATHISRDGGEPYCMDCGKANYDRPREELAKLTPRTLKMYGRG